jgi:hypothetical protein
MGADIYLESRRKLNQKEWGNKLDSAVKKLQRAKDTEDEKKLQQEVYLYYDKIDERAYFRDPYNSSSLLWKLGMSWWTDVADKWVNDGYMPIKHAKEFLKTLKEKEVPAPNDLDLTNCTVDDGNNSREVWHKGFCERKKALEEMVEESIKLKEPLRCSL